MTEHEHMPPMHKWYRADAFSPGKVLIYMPGCDYVLTWDEAHALATAITEALQLERRP